MRLGRNPLLDDRLPLWRARFVLSLLFAGSLALVLRAFYLQGINKDFLIGKGESRYERVIEMAATRGRVLDRNGDVLAVSTPVSSVWVIPEDADLTPPQTRRLADLIDSDARDITRKLATDSGFTYLKRQLAPDVAARIEAMDLPGVHFQEEYRRYYPVAEVAAHLLGFSNTDDVGQEGVELAYESQLAGSPGSRRVIKDNRGRIIEDVESIRAPRDGADVILAIDAKLQYLAYSSLRQAVAKSRARAGGVVVLDAVSGELLALANLPTYNPNNRAQRSGPAVRNRAFTDTFEPGSSLKPFTIALALEKGLVTMDTMIDTGAGRLRIGPATITDTHSNGKLTVAQVLQLSSNVGAAKIALGLEAESMWRMFHQLGFGQSLNSGFPGEAGGRLRPWRRWREIEQATMSYGHGISVTLVQLARSYMVFARDGDIEPLSLRRLDTAPPRPQRVFSAQTAREMRTMLELVTQPGGTGVKARVPGYRVAGKTGTAHKLVAGEYAENKYLSSFVGFAPVTQPRLIVAVIIDEPASELYYGGEVAAPVFSNIVGAALRSLGVPPDAPEQEIPVDAPLPPEGV